MPGIPEVRPLSPIDLPLLHRLNTVTEIVGLDTLTMLTRGIHPLESAVKSAVSLMDSGAQTIVLREGDTAFFGQFRHRIGEAAAHIVFVAPDLNQYGNDERWLRLLEGMISAAGRRSAHTLKAEISEGDDAFTVLQQAGFAVYARQEIWRRDPAPTAAPAFNLVRPATDLDTIALNALYAGVVPRLVRMADAPPESKPSTLVYDDRGGRVTGAITTTEGKNGIYLTAVFDPAICAHRAPEIIESALARLPRAAKLPVYVCVRRYQDWLSTALEASGFAPLISQAVMVRHITSRAATGTYRAVSMVEGVSLALPTVREFTSAEPEIEG